MSRVQRPICGETSPCYHPTPGPTGWNDAADPTHPIFIPKTSGSVLNFGAVLLAKKGGIVAAGGAKKAAELNIWGYFPGVWKNDKEVLESINKNTDEWFPCSQDLKRFAESGKAKGKAVVEGAVNVWNLMCLIARNRPGRVNLFTHAVAGYVGFSGKVVKGNVEFAAGEHTSLDVETMQNAESQGWTFSDKKSKDITMAEVRQALGHDSKLVIYACHAGMTRNYLIRIAKFLRVNVSGFTKDIRYHPVTSAGGGVVRILSWKYSAGDGDKVTDYHDLKPNVTVTPKSSPTK